MPNCMLWNEMLAVFLLPLAYVPMAEAPCASTTLALDLGARALALVKAWPVSPNPRSESLEPFLVPQASMRKRVPLPRLELDEAEAGVLRETLADYVSDLRMEISNTDSMDFREALKEKERLLKRLLERLGPGPP